MLLGQRRQFVYSAYGTWHPFQHKFPFFIVVMNKELQATRIVLREKTSEQIYNALNYECDSENRKTPPE